MEILATSTDGTNDGTKRVVLIHDTDPSQPDGDVYAPIIKFESSWDVHAYEVTEGSDTYVEAFNRFARVIERHEVLEVFERYLRIFHGTRKVTTYGPNQSTDYMYVGFDTDEWAEKVGCDDDHREHDTLSDHRAWLEGDTYGIELQKLETGACGHEGCEEHTAWVEEESVWGFYGEEHAKDSVNYYFPMD